MANRKRVEIDEDAIRRMMAGDVPRLGSRTAAPSGEDVRKHQDAPKRDTRRATAPDKVESPGTRAPQTDIHAQRAGSGPRRADAAASAPVDTPVGGEGCRRASPAETGAAGAEPSVDCTRRGTPQAIGALPPPEEGDAEIPQPKNRRRRDSRDYTATYLRPRPPAVKRQTYVRQSLYTKIQEILAVVAGNLTVPSFIDNVLEEHLERYRDQINALYEAHIRKPL